MAWRLLYRRRMKRLLSACLLASLPVVSACTEAADDAEANLPGDIDNNADAQGAGGKGDAWNPDNDPAQLARSLNYRLADLPKQGKLDKPVWKDRYPTAPASMPAAWADTYWPTYEGSTNNRWIDRQTKSPLEKYDAAYNAAAGCATQPAKMCGATAKADWDQYFTCAGPAAKWQMKSFQSLYQQIDGIDNDGDGQKDECDSSDREGAQGWWGLCHAWTPASLLEPEPQHAVTLNGQTFEVADIKALIITLYDKTDALMLGGRCNAETIEHDAEGADANTECMDVNPGALHVVLTNFLGLKDMAVIEDRTAADQVWNQPLVGYAISKQEKVTATAANACVGASGSTWKFNTSAKSLYEVVLTTDYLVEGSPSKQPLGMASYTSHDTYHYILELGSTGKIIGGKYCTDSVEDHPDFLWTPKGVSTSSYGRNPFVDLAKVRQLINLSISTAQPPPAGNVKTYESTTAAEIPDNAPAGATSDITVPDTFTFTTLSASVDIKHTYRGDLRVSLLKDGTEVAVLSDKVGGSADDLVQTFTLTPAQLAGTSAGKGKWTLKVVDTAAADTGRIAGFKLVFTTN